MNKQLNEMSLLMTGSGSSIYLYGREFYGRALCLPS